MTNLGFFCRVGLSNDYCVCLYLTSVKIEYLELSPYLCDDSTGMLPLEDWLCILKLCRIYLVTD